MAALTDDRSLDQVSAQAPSIVQDGVSTAKTLYMGAFAAALIADGYLAKGGGVALTGPVAGVASHRADNALGADGALSCNLAQGVFKRANSGTDPLAQADFMRPCFAEDDQTVRKTGGSTYPLLGLFLGLDQEGLCIVQVIAGINAVLAALTSAQAQIQIPLTGVCDKDGDPLVKFADGDSEIPGYNLADSEAFGVRWNNKATLDPFLTQIAMPQDLDGSKPIVLHFLASKTGATVGDATSFTATAFFHTVGALHDADADCGGASSAMVGNATAKTVQEVTLTIAAADVPESPSSLSLTVQPTDGTLGTDDVILEAVWIEYARKLLLS